MPLLHDSSPSHRHHHRRRTSAVPSIASSTTASSLRRLPSRFRLKRTSARGAGVGVRAAAVAHRGEGGGGGGPPTPVPCWKLCDSPVPFSIDIQQQNRRHHNRRHHHDHGSPKHHVSARKLAASLWEMHDIPFAQRSSSSPAAAIHPLHSHLPPISQNRKSCADSKGNLIGAALGTAMLAEKAYPNAMVSARSTTGRGDFWEVPNHMQGFDEQQGHESNSHLVAILQAELNSARFQLQNLSMNDRVRSKEVENLTKKLVKQSVRWREQLAESVSLAVDSIRQELEEERKSKQKLELLYKKVEKDLWECKKRLNKAVEELERERKAHQLMKDVCDELAMEISEDKARVEQLKRESVKVREEMEEERKMLQMAEIWREERVQMKLMEAKLALEEKNSALDKLQTEVEVFRKARRSTNDTNNQRDDDGQQASSAAASQRSEGDSRSALQKFQAGPVFHQLDEEGKFEFQGRTSAESLRHHHQIEKQFGGRSEFRDMEEEEEDEEEEDDLHSIELNLESSGNLKWEQIGFPQLQEQVDYRRNQLDFARQKSWHEQSSSSTPYGREVERYEETDGKGKEGRWGLLQQWNREQPEIISEEGRERSIKAWQQQQNNQSIMAQCLKPTLKPSEDTTAASDEQPYLSKSNSLHANNPLVPFAHDISAHNL